MDYWGRGGGAKGMLAPLLKLLEGLTPGHPLPTPMSVGGAGEKANKERDEP